MLHSFVDEPSAGSYCTTEKKQKWPWVGHASRVQDDVLRWTIHVHHHLETTQKEAI